VNGRLLLGIGLNGEANTLSNLVFQVSTLVFGY